MWSVLVLDRTLVLGGKRNYLCFSSSWGKHFQSTRWGRQKDIWECRRTQKWVNTVKVERLLKKLGNNQDGNRKYFSLDLKRSVKSLKWTKIPFIMRLNEETPARGQEICLQAFLFLFCLILLIWATFIKKERAIRSICSWSTSFQCLGYHSKERYRHYPIWTLGVPGPDRESILFWLHRTGNGNAGNNI